MNPSILKPINFQNNQNLEWKTLKIEWSLPNRVSMEDLKQCLGMGSACLLARSASQCVGATSRGGWLLEWMVVGMDGSWWVLINGKWVMEMVITITYLGVGKKDKWGKK